MFSREKSRWQLSIMNPVKVVICQNWHFKPFLYKHCVCGFRMTLILVALNTQSFTQVLKNLTAMSFFVDLAEIY